MKTIIENDVLVRCGEESADVVLKEGVKRIASGAFAGLCLRSIELPHSIQNFEDGALSGCGSPEIFYNGTKEELSRVFFGAHNPPRESVWTLCE